MTPNWTIAEASEGFAKGTLSPVGLVESCLARIDRLDPILHSFVKITRSRALEEARQAERAWLTGKPRSRLHGIPVAVKDIIETAGIETTGQSRLRHGHIASVDATVMRRLSEAGAVLLGKLTTHEFAMGGPSFDLPDPPARNPWDPSRYTGGSSSGAGAAVAAGFVLGAIGTDTGGSIRMPASFCGIAGLKPTYGLVSKSGVFPLASSLDHVGPMGRCTRDCAMLLQVIAGFDHHDQGSANVPVPDYCSFLDSSLQGVRIAAVEIPAELQLSKPLHEALLHARQAFGDLGARIESIRLPFWEECHAALMVITLVEAYEHYGRDLELRWQDFGASFRRRIMPGMLLSANDYDRAQLMRYRIKEQLAQMASEYDALLLPTTSGVAPMIDAISDIGFFGLPNFTGLANLTGRPALSICCGFSEGLPFGLQLIGHEFGEAQLMGIGAAYERSTPWSRQRPCPRLDKTGTEPG